MSRHGTGTRRARQQRSSRLRRTGIVFPAAAVAAIVVVIVSVAAYILSPAGSGAAGADAAIASIPGSQTAVLLEQERKQMIAMRTAANTLTVVAKPKLASPAKAAANNPASVNSSSSGSSAGTPTVPSAPPNPGTAQSTAYNLMASFGFSPTTYFGCLKDLWNRESGWVFDAENASGAYGIPQALPGSKMASAGADWATNPATQEKWGLGYIKAMYGNPCGAWSFEERNGYY